MSALTRILLQACAILALGALSSGAALARQGEDGDDRRSRWRGEQRAERDGAGRRAEFREQGRESRREWRRDGRRDWRDDRHRGHAAVVVPHLPHRHREIRHRHHRYFFADGFWYDPWGSSFIRIAAPVGVVISSLPIGYATVSLGGHLYYRYEDDWYRPHERGYIVVPPPIGAVDAPAADDDTLFAYPRDGQNETQQADDRFQCHEWASAQTGYDPSLASPAGARAGEMEQRPAYLRAMSACLEGRGYTVR